MAEQAATSAAALPAARPVPIPDLMTPGGRPPPPVARRPPSQPVRAPVPASAQPSPGTATLPSNFKMPAQKLNLKQGPPGGMKT
eukprot:1958143-Prymnesium_polylepis.1